MHDWYVSFDQPKCVIRDWLIMMYPNLHLESSGYYAKDDHGNWVWRISIWDSSNRILFNQEDVYVQFVLAWQ